MKRTAWRMTWVIVWLAVAAAACIDPRCPKAYDKRGDTCYRKDAGRDVGISEDGGEEPNEGGNLSEAGDLNSDGGSVVHDAGVVPDSPEIQGAASMAPGRELWTWSAPEGTDHFELLLDDVVPSSDGTPTEARFSARLELGDHTLKVRACRADQTCSEWAVHATRVESFGRDLPRGLRDAARVVPTTALGHRVAIGCNDCADGPKSEVYNLEQAAASIERAIDRGADLIELNVASIARDLYVSPADTASVGARPKLADLLRRETIANSEALLALEVVETAADGENPDALAESIFAVIDESPNVARNGRPLWIRTSFANRGYLQALADESGRHAVTGPYVRLIVSDPGREPQDFYGVAGDALLPTLEFVDAVGVDFGVSNLPYRIERIRAGGSAVVIENVPGPGHGEMVLGSLRELVDVFFTDYRVDQARRIVVKADTGAFFSATDISADGRVLSIHGMRRGTKLVWERELGRTFEDSWFAAGVLTSPAAVPGADPRFYGPHLSFDPVQTYCVVPLVDPAVPREPSGGFLASFVGTMPTLKQDFVAVMFGSPPAPENAPVWNLGVGTSSGALGASIATPEPGQSMPKERAAVRVPMQGNSGCTSRNQPFTATLKEGETRWIALLYDGREFTLFVDGRCAATALVCGVQGEDDVAATTMVGSGIFGASYFGLVQSFTILRWGSTSTDGEN